jgi:hypothetical protein
VIGGPGEINRFCISSPSVSLCNLVGDLVRPFPEASKHA